MDVLVNNAGVYPGGSLLSAPCEELRATFETNLWGAVRTCRAWVPAMLERGHGRIVNVSSGYASRRVGTPAGRSG